MKEWDAQHDIKNVVRGIDDDEAAFLDKVEEVKSAMEDKRMCEEREELEAYRKMKDKLLEEDEERRLKSDVSKHQTLKPSHVTKKQAKLLLGAVVKKRTASESTSANQPPKKSKIVSSNALAGLGGYASSSSEDDS